MTTIVHRLSGDYHLYPLYLKWSAAHFQREEISQGMDYFRLVCNGSQSFENDVYEVLWKRSFEKHVYRWKTERSDRYEYGRKIFHNLSGYSSSSMEKANAINMALKGEDQEKLRMQANKVIECLVIIKGNPKRDPRYGRKAFYSTHGYSSTPLERREAFQMYARESRPLTWFLGNKEIRLIREGDGLKYIGFDAASGRVWSHPINLGGRPVEESISFLAKCDVTLNDDKLVFLERDEFEEWPTYEASRNREIRLIKKDGQVAWHLFDRSNKASSWVLADASAIKVLKCLVEIPASDRISYLKDFDVTIGYDQITSRLLTASIEKISKFSKLDPKKPIDRDNWAITLIDAGKSYSDPGTWGGHAMIAYEGIEAGDQFLRYAHLTNYEVPYPQVQIKEARWRKPRSQSETWIRSRQQAQSMIAKIKREEGHYHSFALIPPLGLNIVKDCPKKIGELAKDNIAQPLCNTLGLSSPSIFPPPPRYYPHKGDPGEKVLGILTKTSNFFWSLLPTLSDFQTLKELSGCPRTIHNDRRYGVQDGETITWLENVPGEPTDNCLSWTADTLKLAGINIPIGLLATLPVPATYISLIGAKPSLVEFTPTPEK